MKFMSYNGIKNVIEKLYNVQIDLNVDDAIKYSAEARPPREE